MRTAIVVAALLHQVVSFVVPPPVRVAPSLGLKLATRAATDDDATAVAAVDDDATPKRRPLRNLWRRIRRKKTEEPSEPEPEQPPLKVGESVVVEATGRSGKVSLVAANGWCQVTYDDEECEGQTETLQCPDLVREEAALAETIDAEVSDFDEVLIMAEDEAVKRRRLCLMRDISETCGNVARLELLGRVGDDALPVFQRRPGRLSAGELAYT